MNKVNEAIYRSPKFLRKFMNFEINTKGDIKGEPSEKEKKRRIWEMWDDTINLRNRYRGDMSFWDEFDKWKKGKEEKAREQRRIERELEDLINKFQNDGRSYPYNDKFEAKNGGKKFEYKFEDGCHLEIDLLDSGAKLVFIDKTHKHTYTVGLKYRNRFVDVCKFIINNSKNRPESNQRSYTRNEWKEREKKSQTSGDPKKDRYNSLKETVRLRKEQLSKMSKSDSEYQVLKNELDAAERALNAFKNKYQFENLSNFSNYIRKFNESIDEKDCKWCYKKFLPKEESQVCCCKECDSKYNNYLANDSSESPWDKFTDKNKGEKYW